MLFHDMNVITQSIYVFLLLFLFVGARSGGSRGVAETKFTRGRVDRGRNAGAAAG